MSEETESRGPHGSRWLVVPQRLRAEIGALAAAGYPEEVCGILQGREAGGTATVEAVRQVANRNRGRPRDRYDLDPEGFLAADREGRSRGLEVVGIWHSHPDHPARPSPTDLEGAWEGWSYAIVSVSAGGAGELRSWRLAGDRFVEEEVAQAGQSQPKTPAVSSA